MSTSQPRTVQTDYERPWSPNQPWHMSLDQARAERASKGYSIESTRDSAAPFVARRHCELRELRVRGATSHSEWRCACGGHEVVVGGYDAAFIEYASHRRQGDYWRIHAIATTRWALVDDTGRVTGLSDDRLEIGRCVLIDDVVRVGDIVVQAARP